MRAALGRWGWLAILVLGAVWEHQGIVRPDWPTLTDLIEQYIPGWAQAAAISWLAYHFLVQRRPVEGGDRGV